MSVPTEESRRKEPLAESTIGIDCGQVPSVLVCNLSASCLADVPEIVILTMNYQVDSYDAKILLALDKDPRASVMALADRTKLSRNTVQARLSKMERLGVLRSYERRIDPAALGYPMTAFILTRVAQRRLAEIATALHDIPEVLELHGLGGVTDLLIHVVAREADDLYRVAGRILDIEGVEQTTTSLVMRKFFDYRLTPLLMGLSEQDD